MERSRRTAHSHLTQQGKSSLAENTLCTSIRLIGHTLDDASTVSDGRTPVEQRARCLRLHQSWELFSRSPPASDAGSLTGSRRDVSTTTPCLARNSASTPLESITNILTCHQIDQPCGSEAWDRHFVPMANARAQPQRRVPLYTTITRCSSRHSHRRRRLPTPKTH